MFPFRHSSIFRSRWIALLWAGSIIWFAMDVAGSPDQSGNGTAADTGGAAADEAQMKEAQKIIANLR